MKLNSDRLRLLLRYDPETGIWIWRKTTNGNMKVGQVAGTLSGDGYISISVDGTVYRAHRLAWLYMTGDWPPSKIDHQDTNRANCKWENLRLATQSQNLSNSRKYKNNTSGFKGVSWSNARRKWCAQIMKDWKTYNLGGFDQKEVAAAVYRIAARGMFGSFARPS